METQLTIAVCTYRRFDWLTKCLKMLEKQTLERDRFTLLVIDNSLTPTESEAFRRALPEDFNGEYIITERAGLSYARNVALEKCETPYIAYIDDDALAAPDWAERVLDTFEKHHGGAGIVGGKITPLYEGAKPEWLAGDLLLYLAIPDWGNTELTLKRDADKWLVGASIAYDTKALRRAGGFPENLGRTGGLLLCHEEFWINQAIRSQGYSVVYNPQIVAEHLIQKERLTQKWLCEAAFWEAVSWMVCCNQNAIENLAGDAEKCALLKDKLDELQETLVAEPTTDAVKNDCLRFKAAGREAMRENGFPIDTPPSGTDYPTVYIVTTCMNAGDTIEQTLASVIQQAGDFYLRYHIQDGGSKDDTLDVIERWRGGLEDGTVKTHCKGVIFSYACERDDGMYDGICKAFGHFDMPPEAFMTWLNADDMLFTGALATIADLQRKQEDVLWITGEIYCTRFNGGLCQATACGFPRWFIQSGLCETRFWQFLQQEGTFWRKSLWDAVGGLNRSMKLAGDYDLWRRFAGEAELWHFLGPLASFHRRPGQLSEDLGSYCEEIDAIIPKEEKEKTYRWAEEEIRKNPDKFHISCLYYDWGSDAYMVTYPSLKDFAPPWKKEMFAGRGTAHAHAPAPAPAAAPAGPPRPAPTPEQADTAGTSAPETHTPVTHVEPELHPAPSISETKGLPATPFAPKDEPPRRGLIGRLKGSIVRARQYRKVRQSGLFLDTYYLERYPDVKRTGIDPLLHYMQHGWREGRNPNPLFDTVYYLRTNRDVEDSGINPLLHYVEHGYSEGRMPSSLFVSNRFLALAPEGSTKTASPLEPYLTGKKGGTDRGSPPPSSKAGGETQKPVIPTRRGEPAGSDLLDLNVLAPYSKRSHLPILAEYAQDLYGKPCKDFDSVDLKYYQQLLVYACIRYNIPAGARVLEVAANGDTQVIKRICSEYECWRLSEHTEPGQDGWKSMTSGQGKPGDQLSDDYFDLVFSTSALQNLSGNVSDARRMVETLQRTTKSGGWHLHLVDATVGDSVELPPIVGEIQRATACNSTAASMQPLFTDPDAYGMSESTYNAAWKEITKMSFAEFGRPVCLNLTWQS